MFINREPSLQNLDSSLKRLRGEPNKFLESSHPLKEPVYSRTWLLGQKLSFKATWKTRGCMPTVVDVICPN
jgi:hypothetical protein